MDAAGGVPCCVIHPFLQPAFAEALSQEFPTIDRLPKRYSEQGKLQDLGLILEPDVAQRVGPATSQLLAFVRSSEFGSFIARLSGQRIDPDITQISLNSYLPYQGLDSHIDHRRGTTGFARPLTMVIHLSQDWKPEWGGRFLLSRDQSLAPPIISEDPGFNVGMLWERTADAWHGVTLINTEQPRRTIALTLQRRDAVSYVYGIRRSALGRSIESSRLGRSLKQTVKRALKR